MSGTKLHPSQDRAANSRIFLMRALTCAHLSHVRHQLSGVELRDAHQVFAVGLVDAQQRQVQGGGQLIAQTSCEIVLNKCQMPDINFLLLEQKRTVAGERTVLTFRKVALSLVTIDGLTLMLSCMINVKLQNKQGDREKKHLAYRNENIKFIWRAKEKQTCRASRRQSVDCSLHVNEEILKK